MHIALATAAALPALDEDAPALIAALAARGCTAEPAIWTDATIDWARFDAVVVRSTWDYARQRDRFVAWANGVAQQTRLLNPAPALRWNTDKRYLGALDVPVVPTVYVAPGEAFGAPDAPFVIKPTISAGSIDTARYAPNDDAAAQLVAQIHASGRTVMVQPYLDAVDDDGEAALVYFGGIFSHAIRKGAMLKLGEDLEAGLFRAEVIEAHEATAAERSVAAQVLAAMPYDAATMAYARVDLIGSQDGPILLELELTEPSLFLGYSQGAADRFAAALTSLL